MTDISEAADGDAAWTVFWDDQFDVILTDYFCNPFKQEELRPSSTSMCRHNCMLQATTLGIGGNCFFWAYTCAAAEVSL